MMLAEYTAPHCFDQVLWWVSGLWQTATWNRPPQIVDFCKLVATLYDQENISFELKRHVETKIVKRFASGGWHPGNAYGSLRICFGDAAVDKAVHKMVSGL